LIHILSGQDDFTLAQALEKIKKEMGDEAILSMGTTTLEGQQLSLGELKTVCETIPFMTGKRLVIVNGLMGRFESQGKSRRPKKTTGKARTSPKTDEAEFFGEYLSGGIPDTTVLVLTEGVISVENAIFKALSGKATFRSFPLPKDVELREWVQKQVKQEGGTISPKAVQLLVRLVGSNLWAMSNEVNKLVLYTSGRKIEEEDVNALVGYTQQATVFNMVDAILEFRAEQAEQMLQNMFLSGAAPVYLLTMLSRQVQLIVRAKELGRQRFNNFEMQSKLGMNNEWVLKKTLDQAGRYSLSRLKEIYQSILETDISIKTGVYDAELALNMLVAELCHRSGKSTSQVGIKTG
jgi:DNA polymerase III subunit delta